MLEMMEMQEVFGRIYRITSFDTTLLALKTIPLIILRCRGNVFIELSPSSNRELHSQTTDSPLTSHGPHRK
jgi:hypothetical protein